MIAFYLLKKQKGVPVIFFKKRVHFTYILSEIIFEIIPLCKELNLA